ncbi:N-acetylmuramoyl-L-alanine amidase [Bacillus sp. FJAT-50079]|uniref:N-acetylmuramoyl-L-alanine amidase n=1 Tax=Bacillus sp. FJAT-50079 TaxID=2833577 RepID=UPI001BCA5C4F|nr:N-acetylmuramoyl-L-alanine amidase [Bacillus sp. FJAT-50079]MBS4208994.1 N-acetylmuramoyl-L-alanine amidase [Bacillus sp. FJAT-50079]
MGRKLFSIIAISFVFIAAIIYVPFALAANAEKVVITGDVVNVREFPGTSNNVITQVREGETYTLEKHEDGWYQIKLSSGKTGWIADWLADKEAVTTGSKAQATKGTVTVDRLNVRTSPGLSGDIVGQLHTGDSVEVLENGNEWSRIAYAKGEAWVSSQYIQSESNHQATSASTTAEGATTNALTILHDGTNIRQKPSIKSKIVSRASSGDVFNVVGKNGDWYEIEYKTGASGFVASWIVSQSNQIATKGTGGLKGKTIVLDPGHGGRDQGAEGANGTLEKELTLKTADMLARKLHKAGAKVIVTRDIDEYVSLNDRAYLAARHQADAFISLHYDSIKDKQVNGHTTYYYHSYEKELAKAINQQIEHAVSLKNRGTRHGNYYVIRENSQPSVLLELGYLSNPSEEKVISTKKFQNAVTDGIVKGLQEYFSK